MSTEPLRVPHSAVPTNRIRLLNERPVSSGGTHVLYWMTAYRRTQSNFALQRAGDWARHLGLPLVVLSALRLDYPWASDRTHAFILDSMADVAGALGQSNAVVLNYVEAERGGGKGLLAALAADAALVVGDDAPVFFLPAMSKAAAERLPVTFEVVDHNGLLPLAATDRVFNRAFDLRRFLQKELPQHLDETPAIAPGELPPAPSDLLQSVHDRWASPPPESSLLPSLALDHSVAALPKKGGEKEAIATLQRFVGRGLDRYAERNHPDDDVASGLSPYLHFGNISVHEVFRAVADAEGWTPADLADTSSGARSGWWGMGEGAESFLDQIVTWRELGYRAARYVPDNGSYDALPNWAKATLAEHSADVREYVYSQAQLEAGETHDDLWNAAQRQLREEGAIHNYLRMLWGKKILEWTGSPEEAHDTMFALNDRYALDGRDPNSISGIHWVLGRYDRAWGPERPIFGKVRYMSSESARRKLRLTEYLGQSKMLNT
ncbi:MAG: deoxyribodipyrimidine photolyase [Acidimicrobiia bacterium]|nr:deoxyribodipyrimidine photolyase [Acidimicrobiia bacterium]